MKSVSMPPKTSASVLEAESFPDALSYRQAVFERLVKLGLSRPFAQLSVDQDARYLDARWNEGASLDDAARNIFGPEIEPSTDGYRDAVGMFLEHYELGVGHTEAILDANGDILEKCHKAKMPPWAVAASLLNQAPGVTAYPVVDVADPRISLELPAQTRDLLETASGLKLLGEDADAVVKTLINQGLMQLVRDGLLKLPSQKSVKPCSLGSN
ncbi:MAG: hypothetical protein V4713_03720 [Pseudomonadota bacterium]